MEQAQRDSQDNIRRIAPVISQAYNQGRQKHVDEAFNTLKPYLQRDEVPVFFCEPVGWAIYRYLKAHLHSLTPQEAKTIFGYYLRLAQQKARAVHSYMMILAIDYKNQYPQDFHFEAFCRKWGLNAFRDEDFQTTKATTPEQKQTIYPPLAARVATKLYKELKSTHSKEKAEEFLPFFHLVNTHCPDFAYTPLYIANLQAWCGQKDEAIKQLRKMLIDNQQWYLWKNLGDLLPTNLQIACYCKAITLCNKEDYLLDIHLTLATLLQATAPHQAAYELSMYTATSQRNGWRKRAQAYTLEKTLQPFPPQKDGKAYYASQAPAAEDYAFEGLPQDEFLYTGTYINPQGKRRARLVNHPRQLTLTTTLTPELRNSPIGEVFLCTYHTKGHRNIMLTAHATGKTLPTNNLSPYSGNTQKHHKDGSGNPGAPTGETKLIEGNVNIRSGQAFAFIGNYYVPPRLRQSANLAQGQHVKAKALRQPDGRWRIIEILQT